LAPESPKWQLPGHYKVPVLENSPFYRSSILLPALRRDAFSICIKKTLPP